MHISIKNDNIDLESFLISAGYRMSQMPSQDDIIICCADDMPDNAHIWIKKYSCNWNDEREKAINHLNRSKIQYICMIYEGKNLERCAILSSRGTIHTFGNEYELKQYIPNILSVIK